MAKRLQRRESQRTQKRGHLGDSFQNSGKFPLNTRCPKCDLIFHDGVWKRGSMGIEGNGPWKLCPACVQVRDGHVGGLVQFSGSFAEVHRQEILNRIHNVEKRTQEERPLERIMSVKEDKEGIFVFATTEHLAARISKSIQRDFGGSLNLRYAPEDKFAFAHWHRD